MERVVPRPHMLVQLGILPYSDDKDRNSGYRIRLQDGLANSDVDRLAPAPACCRHVLGAPPAPRSSNPPPRQICFGLAGQVNSNLVAACLACRIQVEQLPELAIRRRRR